MGDPLGNFFPKKVSQCRKTERGNPLEFFNIKKLKGEPLRKNKIEEKSHNVEKTERWQPLVSPGTVCYAEKQENPFWFSSLGEMVQFDTIIFRRTFEELFWSVRVD